MKRSLVHAYLLIAILGSSAAAFAQDKLQDKGGAFVDAVITQRVTTAFESDPVLNKMHISVETREGVVHLTGSVNSVAQVERAEALARRITGVNAVKNTIRVINRPSRA